ncbi:apolipo protein O-domain-containing protein [Protomyces lactucae-debilis]|uniref:MICOS complex subunit n=1 Tax=Protomyces lactucae-debilis TaxID=2754530 RepID=A0A1Y2FST5_PROLT|nr:apolipo protein O-domain-containing protein [Protomyces lactucae-debilis]ORY87063.1 apolipo protein O-domain-containing protein [Protomyces lactucae-debilis]
MGLFKTKLLLGTAAIGSGSYYLAGRATPRQAEAARRPIPTPAHAQSPAAKLSAYDQDEGKFFLVPQPPTELEKNIRVGRTYVIEKVDELDALLRRGVDKVIAAEHQVENTVKEIRPKQEPLMPGSLYTAIAALSGSIVSRNRNILFRFATPLLFGVGAGAYFLPETSRNVGNVLYRWEGQIPGAQRYHDMTVSHAKMGYQAVLDKAEDATHVLSGAVESGKEALEENAGIKLSK